MTAAETETQQETDYALAQKAAQGDMAPFEQLYQRHNRRVYSLCLRMTGNVSEAEDLSQEVQIRRPGPEFMLRAGKVARTFSHTINQLPTAASEDVLSAHEQGLKVIADMSDSELAAVMVFARELVCAMLVSPRLVQNPRPGADEVGPDDIGEDFWFLFNYAMSGFFNLKVPVGSNQEVEVSDLESFRPEPGLSGDCDNRSEVRPDSEQPLGDKGLVVSP